MLQTLRLSWTLWNFYPKQGSKDDQGILEERKESGVHVLPVFLFKSILIGFLMCLANQETKNQVRFSDDDEFLPSLYRCESFRSDT